MVKLDHLSKASKGFNMKLAPKYAGSDKEGKFVSLKVFRAIDCRDQRSKGVSSESAYARPEDLEEEDDSDQTYQEYPEVRDRKETL